MSDNPPNPEDIHGHGDAHMPLVEFKTNCRAIANGFPVSGETKKKTVEVAEAFLNSTSAKYRRAGLYGVAMLERINVTREAMAQRQQHHEEGEQVNVNHTGTVTVEAKRTELLGIIATLRQRAGVAENSGAVAANGHSRLNGHAHPPDVAAG